MATRTPSLTAAPVAATPGCDETAPRAIASSKTGGPRSKSAPKMPPAASGARRGRATPNPQTQTQTERLRGGLGLHTPPVAPGPAAGTCSGPTQPLPRGPDAAKGGRALRRSRAGGEVQPEATSGSVLPPPTGVCTLPASVHPPCRCSFPLRKHSTATRWAKQL